MIRNISIGIDMGSAMTRVVVGEFLKGEKNPKIIGVGEAPSLGLRHGYITSFDQAVISLRQAIEAAEKTSGVKIKRASLAISGSTLRGTIASGSAVISKADGEVTELDQNRALENCEENLALSNKKIIEVSPLSYRLDGKEVLGRLSGMRGNKLEVKALFTTYSSLHLEDMIAAVAEAGVEVVDVVPSPVAASRIALGERQKVAGVALVNVGAETVSLAVFENGILVSIHSFGLGASDITNDIALGLRIPLELAESFKLGNDSGEYSKKKLDEIIEARFEDIFESIDNHFKKIKRSELLPAGVVLVGGGANTLGIEEFAKHELSLPSIVGSTDMFGNVKTKLRDPSWYVVLGLLMGPGDGERYGKSNGSSMFKDLKNSINKSLKQLMP
jgi:cell division protein FtsA